MTTTDKTGLNYKPLGAFHKNDTGRDFVVGDIHGCFSHLEIMLQQVKFDVYTDRLFSMGDLVDYGPRSYDVLDWLSKPWFHTVRGDHEERLIFYADGDKSFNELYPDGEGSWILDLSKGRLHQIADAFNLLPYAIEIETHYGLVGIVHAEPLGYWQGMTKALQADMDMLGSYAMAHIVSSRERINESIMSDIEGIHAVYVGHTIVPKPYWMGNVCYIDTGCAFGQALTMIDLNDPDKPIMLTNTTTRWAPKPREWL